LRGGGGGYIQRGEGNKKIEAFQGEGGQCHVLLGRPRKRGFLKIAIKGRDLLAITTAGRHDPDAEEGGELRLERGKKGERGFLRVEGPRISLLKAVIKRGNVVKIGKAIFLLFRKLDF